MTIDTKTISGRRTLEFDTLDDVLADAEILTAKHATTVGNWTLGQIFQHLANTMNLSIDGSDFRAPWYFRLIGPLILRSILKKGMSPGYQLSAPAGALERGRPLAWHEERAGSLVTLNSIVVGVAGQRWLDLLAGKLRTSYWHRLRWLAGSGLETDFGSVGAADDCLFCRRPERGAA